MAMYCFVLLSHVFDKVTLT